MKVIRKRLDELHLDPANARTHDSRNLEAIRSSLKQFGQVEPVVVQASTGKVIGGNGRVAVLRELGETEVDAVLVDVDDLNATALGIALNRSAELAGWDEGVLGRLLSELRDEGLAELVGFSDREIDKLLGPPPGQCDPDEIPDPPADPTARPGDVWLLGDHRLVVGDCTDPTVVALALDGEEPRLLLTDPPYGVELDMEWRDRAGLNALGPAEKSYLRSKSSASSNTTISGDTRSDWADAYALVPSLDTAYIWHASAHAVEVAQGLERIGFRISQQLVWKKTHFALSRQFYHWGHEPCWLARKPKALPFKGSRDQGTVWEAASPKMIMSGSDEDRVDHPCQKPAVLYSRPIENHLDRGECFYEPFAGSGTGIIAAEQTGRRCLAVELDPKYADVIVARWERFTGKQAEVARP